ncbi:hypothetical protein BDR04DRAFT_1181032, partial [Suillus decipiens]
WLVLLAKLRHCAAPVVPFWQLPAVSRGSWQNLAQLGATSTSSSECCFTDSPSIHFSRNSNELIISPVENSGSATIVLQSVAVVNILKAEKNLPISAKTYPLKTLAITLFSIVPHAADVERLFSDLGGIQNVKRCNLTVRTFETLGKTL